MQENKTGALAFLTNFLVIFGITVLIVTVIGVLAGEESMQYSSMFKLGGAGVAYITLFQLAFADLIITILNRLFFSEKVFKTMMVMWRTIFMVFSIIAVMVVFIFIFKWFPVDFVPGWIGFFVSFGTCFVGSTVISVIKTKADDKKYNELLEQYKKNQELF